MITNTIGKSTSRSIEIIFADTSDGRKQVVTVYKDNLSEKEFRERIAVRATNEAIQFAIDRDEVESDE